MVWVHRVIEKHPSTKRGICSNCGPVEIRKKKNSWICVTGKRIGVQEAYQIRTYGKIIGDRPLSCSVCGKTGKICYDHDHTTGDFRGWLCSSCNLALGNVKDDPELLRKLAEYLDRYNNETRDST